MPIAMDLGAGNNTINVEAPDLNFTASGANLLINTYYGFNSNQLTAENLTIHNWGEASASAYVSGTTHLTGGGDFTLTGDLNVLTTENSYSANINVIDDNDVILGDMVLTDSAAQITSTADGGTVSQAEGTHISGSSLAIFADHIDLGADGTASIITNWGLLDLNFDQSLRLSGLIEARGSFSYIWMKGSDAGTTVDLTQTADLKIDIEDEFDLLRFEFTLGDGDDTVNLASSLPIPMHLGEGADTVNIFGPDIDYAIADFDPSQDTINPYSP